MILRIFIVASESSAIFLTSDYRHVKYKRNKNFNFFGNMGINFMYDKGKKSTFSRKSYLQTRFYNNGSFLKFRCVENSKAVFQWYSMRYTYSLWSEIRNYNVNFWKKIVRNTWSRNVEFYLIVYVAIAKTFISTVERKK